MRAGLFLCLTRARYPSGDAWREALELVQALANEHGRDACVLDSRSPRQRLRVRAVRAESFSKPR
jgi:hypothetical protein